MNPLTTIAGWMLLVGGGTTTPAIVDRFAELIGGKDQPVVILAQTRANPLESGPGSLQLLHECGLTNVTLFTESEIRFGDLRKISAAVYSAKGLWVPGGDQSLFVQRFGALTGRKLIQNALDRGISVFGTSAGAMMMSNPMISGTREDGTPEMEEGLGTLGFVVDTHYRARSRQSRLQWAVNATGHKGIGLDEGAWILVQEGEVVDSSFKLDWVLPNRPQDSQDHQKMNLAEQASWLR